LSQPPKIVVPKYRWNDDSAELIAHEFRIHHHPSDTTVSIVEWMDFGNHEHDENRGE